jgi:hypothetical protein
MAASLLDRYRLTRLVRGLPTLARFLPAEHHARCQDLCVKTSRKIRHRLQEIAYAFF